MEHFKLASTMITFCKNRKSMVSIKIKTLNEKARLELKVVSATRSISLISGNWGYWTTGLFVKYT